MKDSFVRGARLNISYVTTKHDLMGINVSIVVVVVGLGLFMAIGKSMYYFIVVLDFSQYSEK